MEFIETEINKFAPSSKPVFVDADSILYYSMPPVEEIELLSDEEGLERSLTAFLEIVKIIKEACNSSGKMTFFFSCARKDNYRLHFDESYKLNRSDQKRPRFVSALKFHVLKNYANAIECVNVEADDAVAYMHKHSDGNCIICSPDKDVLGQLPGEHFDYRKQTIVETKASSAERFLFLQMLAGDSTDGIKGLPKVGLKTADKILSNSPSFDEVVALYEERGLTRLNARTTAYLVDISRINRALLNTDISNRSFVMHTIDLIY